MTLVELLVVIFVSALFLGMLAMLFVNGWSAQQRAAERDKATGNANIVTSIVSSVRNATVIRVDGTGTRLDAAVVSTTGAWDCRSWALKKSGSLYNLYYVRTGTAPLPVDATTGTPAITGVGTLLTGGAVFVKDGARGVSIGMSFTVGQETVKIRDGVTAQAIESGAPTCWSP